MAACGHEEGGSGPCLYVENHTGSCSPWEQYGQCMGGVGFPWEPEWSCGECSTCMRWASDTGEGE